MPSTSADLTMAQNAGEERLVWAALLHPLTPEASRLVLERLRFAGRDIEAIARLLEAAIARGRR